MSNQGSSPSSKCSPFFLRRRPKGKHIFAKTLPAFLLRSAAKHVLLELLCLAAPSQASRTALSQSDFLPMKNNPPEKSKLRNRPSSNGHNPDSQLSVFTTIENVGCVQGEPPQSEQLSSSSSSKWQAYSAPLCALENPSQVRARQALGSNPQSWKAGGSTH